MYYRGDRVREVSLSYPEVSVEKCPYSEVTTLERFRIRKMTLVHAWRIRQHKHVNLYGIHLIQKRLSFETINL